MKLEDVRTLATFAPVELGDTILATPLYRALRVQYPQAHFTVLSQLPSHPVLAGFEGFDAVVDYQPEASWSGEFDLVVLPVLCGDIAVRRHFDKHPFVISADRRFAESRNSFLNKWDGRFSHVLFYRHQVEMNMELAYEAGYKGEILPLHCPRRDQTEFEAFRGKVGLFINTPTNEFQAMANRQWPLDHWQALLDRIGISNTILVGGSTDRPNVERLAQESGAEFVVTASLAEFTALCGVLRALVSTDGGAMHAAATTTVPIISLHGTSSPILLHPWIYPNGKCIAVLSPNTCSPCQRTYRLRLCETGLTKMDCMQNIKPEFVEQALYRIDDLDAGSCLIMKGDRFMSKEAYLRSGKRAFEFAFNYNVARAAIHLMPSS